MNGLHESAQILHELDQACKASGTRSAWAEENNLSPAYVSDVLNGRRDPSQAILNALGYEKVVMYRKMRKQREQSKGK